MKLYICVVDVVDVPLFETRTIPPGGRPCYGFSLLKPCVEISVTPSLAWMCFSTMGVLSCVPPIHGPDVVSHRGYSFVASRRRLRRMRVTTLLCLANPSVRYCFVLRPDCLPPIYCADVFFYCVVSPHARLEFRYLARCRCHFVLD